MAAFAEHKEDMAPELNSVQFDIRGAANLDAKDRSMFGRATSSDPFAAVILTTGMVDRSGRSLVATGGSPAELFRTDVVKKNLDPTWQKSRYQSMFDHRLRQFKVKVFDYDQASANDLVRSASLTDSRNQPTWIAM